MPGPAEAWHIDGRRCVGLGADHQATPSGTPAQEGGLALQDALALHQRLQIILRRERWARHMPATENVGGEVGQGGGGGMKTGSQANGQFCDRFRPNK